MRARSAADVAAADRFAVLDSTTATGVGPIALHQAKAIARSGTARLALSGGSGRRQRQARKIARVRAIPPRGSGHRATELPPPQTTQRRAPNSRLSPTNARLTVNGMIGRRTSSSGLSSSAPLSARIGSRGALNPRRAVPVSPTTFRRSYASRYGRPRSRTRQAVSLTAPSVQGW